MQNPFHNPAFSMANLTAAINQIPNRYGKLEALRLMPEKSVRFRQVLVEERTQPGSFRKVFSGWLFKNSPSLNVVEHPIYDVWVKDCAMKFPGEEPVAAAEESKAE